MFLSQFQMPEVVSGRFFVVFLELWSKLLSIADSQSSEIPLDSSVYMWLDKHIYPSVPLLP